MRNAHVIQGAPRRLAASRARLPGFAFVLAHILIALCGLAVWMAAL
jgi:hypothetical protein